MNNHSIDNLIRKDITKYEIVLAKNEHFYSNHTGHRLYNRDKFNQINDYIWPLLRGMKIQLHLELNITYKKLNNID